MISFKQEHSILVTGASSGIGETIALRLNALGATVIANGRNVEKLKAIKESAAVPGAFHIATLDLTRYMSVLPEWVRSLREEYGKLAGFVHSAGLGLTAPLREYDLATAHELFDIHFHVPMLLAQGFADRRNNIGRGAAMVFMASSSAVFPVRAKLIYAAAKGALLTAARCIARELAPQGIRANSIAPALVSTPMGEGYGTMLGDEGFTAEQALYPLGLGKPGDVAGMAVFLLSDAGQWITGQTIVMDGGRY